MSRHYLEKYQVVIYLVSILFGLACGIFLPNFVGLLDALLWHILALLLYTTFIQIPLVHIRNAITDMSFIKSAVVGNFILIPLILWAIIHFMPTDLTIRLGILLVLLVPCTDWFITFSHLGGGDTKHAIAFAPISLILQIILLPFYLLLFLGENFTVTLARQEMITAFVGLIILPLFGAFITEKWVYKDTRRIKLLDFLAWMPVPLLAMVVFIISATQVNIVSNFLGILCELLFVFVGFLAIALLLAILLTHLFRLPSSQGRVLAFSLSTRNSFVVLPLALALPQGYELTVVTIVFQSLVELFGMVFFLWLVPKKIFPDSK